jgi:hypothetical protein
MLSYIHRFIAVWCLFSRIRALIVASGCLSLTRRDAIGNFRDTFSDSTAICSVETIKIEKTATGIPLCRGRALGVNISTVGLLVVPGCLSSLSG